MAVPDVKPDTTSAGIFNTIMQRPYIYLECLLNKEGANNKLSMFLAM